MLTTTPPDRLCTDRLYHETVQPCMSRQLGVLTVVHGVEIVVQLCVFIWIELSEIKYKVLSKNENLNKTFYVQ